MKNKTLHMALVILTALVLITGLSACGGGGSTTPATTGATLSGSAQ
ncbi:hypothetical protein [Geopsychrobacter electrodiphilus]|nr:hypothetical protein [Geopsychrobacter electrodiphilus]